MLKRLITNRNTYIFNRLLSTSSIINHDTQRKIEVANKLKELMIEHGSFISPKMKVLDYSFEDMGLGLQAIENIEKFELLASIPIELCLSSKLEINDGEKNDFDLNTNQDVLLTGKETVLSAKLAVELIDDKQVLKDILQDNTMEDPQHPCLAAYIELLRQDEMFHLPLLWSDDRLSSLNGLGVQDILLSKKILIKQMSKNSGIPFSSLLNAVSIVQSRAFGFSSVGKNGTVSLIPFLDIINHVDDSKRENGSSMVVFNKKLNAYQLIACSSIISGSQILASYGTKTPQDYYINYGYLDKKNILSLKNKLSESFTTVLYLNSLAESRKKNNGNTGWFYFRSVLSIKAEMSIPAKLKGVVLSFAVKKRIKQIKINLQKSLLPIEMQKLMNNKIEDDENIDNLAIESKKLKKNSKQGLKQSKELKKKNKLLNPEIPIDNEINNLAPNLMNDIQLLHWLELRSYNQLLLFIEDENTNKLLPATNVDSNEYFYNTMINDYYKHSKEIVDL
jgi:hypothetical protein